MGDERDTWLEDAIDEVMRAEWPSEPPPELTTIIELPGLADVEPVPTVERTEDGSVVLTVEDVARRLKCGRTTVYHLIRSGELRSVKIGALRRVTHADLEEYVDRKVAEVPATPYAATPRPARGRRCSPLPPNWPATKVSGE